MLDDCQISCKATMLIPTVLIAVTFYIIRATALLDTSCNPTEFPKYFVFGAGSSAYQIEGAWNVDGKGRSLFDWYYNRPVWTAANGNVADDSYHKYLDDIAVMKQIGLQRFRFSIAWTRILPNGLGSEINQLGIDHYNKVIDALLEAGIEPFVTINHFDAPLTLNYFGTWTSPAIVDYFVGYADILFSLFGDRVKLWGTINEPQIMCTDLLFDLYNATNPSELPYGTYEYACVHHVILAHARTYQLYHSKYKHSQQGKIGLVMVPFFAYPLTNSSQDVEAAHRENIFSINWLMDPLVHGDYPQLMKDLIGKNSIEQNFFKSRLPEFTPEEKLLIKGAFDVVMINYYFPYQASWEPYNNTPSYINDIQASLQFSSEWPKTNRGFPIYNPGLKDLLNYLKDNFGSFEVIISENGYSNVGGVDDSDRIAYIQDALTYLRQAMCDGVQVTGYNYWSLLDSFEFSALYTAKFGLVDIDYSSSNLTRTLKDSAYYYKDLIDSRLIIPLNYAKELNRKINPDEQISEISKKEN